MYVQKKVTYIDHQMIYPYPINDQKIFSMTDFHSKLKHLFRLWVSALLYMLLQTIWLYMCQYWPTSDERLILCETDTLKYGICYLLRKVVTVSFCTKVLKKSSKWFHFKTSFLSLNFNVTETFTQSWMHDTVFLQNK